MGDATAEAHGIRGRYYETEDERVLTFERVGAENSQPTDGVEQTAVIAQNLEGYAMLKVRLTENGDELERYYGFDMALDHVGELLGVSPHALPVPTAGEDMGM